MAEVTADVYKATVLDNAGLDQNSESYADLVERGIAIARMVAAMAAALMGRNPDDAAFSAGAAVTYNAFFVPIIIVGGIAISAYDVYNTYTNEGVEAALKQAGVEIIVATVGGAAVKAGVKAGVRVYKIGTKYIPVLEAPRAWAAYLAETPALSYVVQKMHAAKQKAAAITDDVTDYLGAFFDKAKAKFGFGGSSSSNAVAEATTSGPYDPRAMERHLRNQYPDTRVTSTTLPPEGSRGTNLAGQRHPKQGIVFDQRGFPIFDDIAKFDTRIPREVSSLRNRKAHMEAATRQLRDNINAGKLSSHHFTSKQLQDIQAVRDRIDGLTWHHHQDLGRMQLISRETHNQIGHLGGFSMWFGK